ncbi:MAG: deoxyribodipyrimidine photo-lyase [Verrucomicrobia bacterium]|nr:deoxyribodipyrimidine photo-lyase [Verrucomicrobiota bacterium]
MSSPVTLVWFRNDLRLADNPALSAAIARGGAVVPVFIWAPEEETPWEPGGASRWWLHQSLVSLDADLSRLGTRLILRKGPTLDTLIALLRETGADAVHWNRRYEPQVIARDTAIKEGLGRQGYGVESHGAALLHEPWTVQNQSGKPFQVFTPFWKHCLGKPDPSEPLPPPGKMRAPGRWPAGVELSSLGLEPGIPWAGGMKNAWTPGEDGAHRQLETFLKGGLSDYSDQRNRPDLAGTSRLSPHLHFGEISPRQIWHGVRKRATAAPAKASATKPSGAFERMAKSSLPDAQNWRTSQFLAEVGWREFAHHLLFHFPKTPAEPLRQNFTRFPWRSDAALLKAWQKGRTGYPIVDAGMRELWTTGWMHNRVRMIVASFLVKDLMISWSEGAAWFWDTLVDADLAQNTLGWQWTAGCGADAAPFFRVFNPVSQGEKFDPQGQYVRKWCPELARLPDNWLHQPFEAPAAVLKDAGISLGRTYPEPVVLHGTARNIALDAYARVSKGTS